MNNTNNSWLNKDMKDLFDVIAKIDSKESVTNFFRDICTIKEIKSITERWKVCKLLEK